MNDWTEVRLGDLVMHKKGFAFKSGTFQAAGVPVVKVTNFTDSSIDRNGLDHVSEGLAVEKSSYALHTDDAVIQTVGSWPNNPRSVVGRVIRVPADLDGALLNQNAVILRPKKDILQRYLFYVLKDRSFKGFIINTAQGAANQASITLDSIYRFQFYLPKPCLQEKIAGVLAAYDELIDNNNRRLTLLENIAENLYREWFVRLRFPDHNITTIEKGVPSGWRVAPLRTLVSEIRDGVKKIDLDDDELYIGLEHIPRKSFSLKEYDTADSVASNKLLFKERDILFSKIRPYLHKVVLSHVAGACSSDTIVLRPKAPEYEAFLLFTVFSNTFIELATVSSKGTKMPRADWAFLEKLEIKIPPDDLLISFQTSFNSMFDQIANLLQANIHLAQSRDALLGRIVTGKLELESADVLLPPSVTQEHTPVEEKELAHA